VDIGTAQINVPWVFSFSQTGTNLGSASKPTSTIVWSEPNCDKPGVLISGSLAETIVLPTGQQSSVPGSSTSNIEVTQEAPGEVAIKCTLSAYVKAVFGTQIPDSTVGTAILVVKADFLGLISVNVPGTIKQAGPQKNIKYTLDITNLGNSQTDLIFSLSEGATSGGWNPLAPPKITLGSTQQGATNTVATVEFTVNTPYKNGWNNKEKSMTLTITPQSTKDFETKGAPVDVPVLARVRGVYVPTLEPLFMLGAVLGVALLARRRTE
jgi:hypothetical protein